MFKPTPIFSVTRENLHPFGMQILKMLLVRKRQTYIDVFKYDDFQSLYFLQYFKGYLGNVSLVLVRS